MCHKEGIRVKTRNKGLYVSVERHERVDRWVPDGWIEQ